jgi:hypothetical protein
LKRLYSKVRSSGSWPVDEVVDSDELLKELLKQDSIVSFQHPAARRPCCLGTRRCDWAGSQGVSMGAKGLRAVGIGSMVSPVPAQQRDVFLKIQQDTKNLIWACFVGLQSETNDRLDKERQLGI